MKIVRPIVGAVSLVFALLLVVSPIEDDAPRSELLAKYAVVVALGAFALYLVGFRALRAKGWRLVWLLGWALVVFGSAVFLAACLQAIHVSDWAERLLPFLVALIVPFVLIGLGTAAITFARRATVSAAPAAVDDKRPPVLYLRPFDVDAKAARVHKRQGSTALLVNTRTEEELLVRALNEIGPCVAIGRQGEELPHLGFRRQYVSDDEAWQETVLRVMSEAQLVVLMGGSSPGAIWEVRKALELVPPQRLIVLVPADGPEREAFIEVLEQAVPGFDRRIPHDTVLPARTFKAILYFGADRATRRPSRRRFCADRLRRTSHRL